MAYVYLVISLFAGRNGHRRRIGRGDLHDVQGAGQRQNGYDHAYHRTDRLGTFPRPVAIGQRTAALLGAVVGIAAVWPVDRYRRWRQASAASFPEGVIREVAHTRQQVARRHPAFAGDLQFVDDDAAVGAGDREVGCACRSRRCRAAALPRPVRNVRRRFWPYRSAPPS